MTTLSHLYPATYIFPVGINTHTKLKVKENYKLNAKVKSW